MPITTLYIINPTHSSYSALFSLLNNIETCKLTIKLFRANDKNANHTRVIIDVVKRLSILLHVLHGSPKAQIQESYPAARQFTFVWGPFLIYLMQLLKYHALNCNSNAQVSLRRPPMPPPIPDAAIPAIQDSAWPVASRDIRPVSWMSLFRLFRVT